MDNLFQDKTNIVLAIAIVAVGLGVGKKVVINSVADKVIQKLERSYSPSPYGPSLDPDKVDVIELDKSK